MRILLANDEGNLRSALSRVLKLDGHEVIETSGGEALTIFSNTPFPLVIADINMVDINGIELLKRVKKVNSDTEVIVTTSYASLDTAVSALRNGAYDYLIKNFEDFELIADVVNRAAEKIQLNLENKILLEKLQQEQDELEGHQAELHDLAMIDGESGLYNHDYFREMLVVELKRSSRHGHQFSLLFVDLKPFVDYARNTGYKGNSVHELGDCLKASLRRTDVVMRFSSDTIAVVLPETPKDGALRVVEKMRTIEEKLPCLGDKKRSMAKVNVTIGVSTFPDDGDNSIELLKCGMALLEGSEGDQKAVE